MGGTSEISFLNERFEPSGFLLETRFAFLFRCFFLNLENKGKVYVCKRRENDLV